MHLPSFRLEGRAYDPDQDEKDTGVDINSCVGVEINNMEIQGFSDSAIKVNDSNDRIDIAQPDKIRIHDNFIHDNKHHGGFGYGVSIAAASALIEHNVFDGNRHAITAAAGPAPPTTPSRTLS